MKRQILSFLLTAGATATLALAQVNSADTRFMNKAAQGGMAEVKLGQLAIDKGSNQAVKDFGQRMVTDHTNADNQLQGIASKDGVTLPSGLDAKDQATYDRLSKMSGTEFDRAYMRDMVKDHQMDVNEFRREGQTAKNRDVKSFAQKTLPTLEEHLSLARRDSSKVGLSAQR